MKHHSHALNLMFSLLLWAGIIAVAVAMSGCDTRPKHAEWQNVCVKSHDEFLYMQTTYMSCGQTCQTPIMVPVYDTVCDQWQIQCVGGKDGSKKCSPPS